MDLVEKYLGERNEEYLHIVEEEDPTFKSKEGSFSVMHSVHDHPRLGGQVLKSFKNKKEAMAFASKHKKNEIVMTWKKVGSGYRANWLRGGIIK